MILCEWDAPEGHPGECCAHLYAIILSTSFTSVSIFSVCCYSRYLSLWGNVGGEGGGLFLLLQQTRYITLILSPSNSGVSLKDDKIAKAGCLDFALKEILQIHILVCVFANFLKEVTVPRGLFMTALQ